MGNSYYKKVKEKKNLRRAWQNVYENGIRSKSKDTRAEIEEFSKDIFSKIDRIYYQLTKKKFIFTPAKGIPVARQGKKPRPIVKSPIPSRIVQRSILDVLQAEPKIREYIFVDTSFGGIENRSVKDAVKMAYDAMTKGSLWYIRSDIKDFFTKIPKDKVLEKINGVIQDNEFNLLLKNAVHVELENLSELGINKELFPIYELGVAQGCCLSPLMGNLLLHEFDKKMNGRGVICFRYVDDFIILGSTQKQVKAAFKSAQKILSQLGLNAYDPFKDIEKAEFGETRKGFVFLGCEIMPGFIRPTKKARKNLIAKIENHFRDASNNMSYLIKGNSDFKKSTFIKVLTDVSNLVMGWGNQYSFCNDMSIVQELDKEINVRIQTYLMRFNEKKGKIEADFFKVRRLLGVQILLDIKTNSVI